MPDPGAYGPVPWSHPRPRSLWGYVVLYLVTFVYYTAFIWEGSSNIFGWIPGLIVIYLAWRGSKIAWAVAIVSAAIYLIVSATEVQTATAPGGHHPMVHVIEALLLLAMLVLLLAPQTRRFYDLDARRQMI